MDDISPRVVNDTILEQESPTPDTEGPNRVTECHPQRHKNHPGREVHPTQEAPRQNDDRDGTEHELEIHHTGLRELLCECRCREVTLLELKAQVDGNGRVAHQRQHLGAERHLVAPEHPADHDAGEGIKGHEGRVDGPFVLHPSRIENDKAWDRLQRDEGAGSQLPGVVARVEPGWGDGVD